MASYSARVWPPGTPNTCRTPCSASKPASSAPPCCPGVASRPRFPPDGPEPPEGTWSGTGSPEQPGRVAAEHEFLGVAEAQRTDLPDGIVGDHVKGPVRAEQDLPGTGVADQIREEIVVVGDGVVVEPAQRRVRA